MFVISKSLKFVDKYLNQGHERSIKAKKNIIGSLLIKGVSIIISLLMVPIVINYINPTKYGIWLTVSSIVGWFSFFDIGLTQGLRNKFAEAIAHNDSQKAKIYVSTTYAVLGIVFSSVWLIFIFVNQFLDWTRILNVDATLRSEVTILAIIVFTYFCISFILRIVSTIITANQEPAKASLITVLGHGISLLIVLILTHITQGSLVKLGLALCLSPIVVLVLANLYFFRKDLNLYRPSFRYVNFKYGKELFNLGVKFFVIQLAGIIQFQTANIIIAQYYGPSEVTSYNIVYKYFSVLNMLFTIFLAPFWSASTEAFLKKDIAWIRNSMKKYNHLNIILAIVGILMLIFSQTIYKLWLGDGTVNISFTLTLWGMLYFNVLVFGGKYVNFLNGINALKLQFVSSILSPIIYIIVALFMINYLNNGVQSLYIAAIIANFNAILLAPFQYYMIIIKKKRGIWLK
ncbi:MATE family efflux transporter [Saccharicrinis sp. FJH54]|uniref:MATE family efflux transporter n=1 Tax=Saccharicrinis sp. FJH54 TaxID=3344665 RepID=UPI0035D44D32